MNKFFIVLLAIAALIGISNCVLIEPAFAYKDQASHSESGEDSDCCFIHCSSCHHYLTSQASALMHNVLLLADVLPTSNILHHDSPVGSIFHPPIAV